MLLRSLFAAALACLYLPGAELNLSSAHISAPAALSKTESKAIELLRDEIEKRSLIRLESAPSSGGPAIVITRGNGPAEGYTLKADAAQVSLAANDARGMLFGIGRLLRELRMRRGRILIDSNLNIRTAPKYSLRGHQLGYRPKTNSYDGWSVPVWEQYIRDLAVFGTNAVELIPPRSDDAADSPHFPLPPMQMMIEMSRLLDEYGLDTWIWYPAMDKDYSDPKTVEFALNEWGEVFRKLPRVDAVFVPGGDPGHTQPKFLMALLEKETRVLRQYHPKAQMWVSPQSFNREWLDEFLDILNREQPAWLSGVVFGPQVRIGLPELRAKVPQRYPIRHYPDITHSLQSQYPVPDWDVAYAVTENREVINPRPLDQAAIFRRTQPYTVGFLTYSEGCNDDVNKFIWSGLGWDPNANVLDILRQYSRYFIGDEYEDSFAQ
ncbi:MAG TPA: glycoside hydrolase family 20 zincin-like fold domain-containing protein, partial [Bryobacteraceae bacterium]